MNLITSRLLLKPVHFDDAEQIYTYRSDAVTNQYQGWIPKTLEDVEKFISKISTEVNIPGTWYQFVIMQKESDKIIGDLGIHFLDTENLQAEIGYTLAKEFHGNGYATEAVKCVLDYLFHDLKKHRIIASIDPANEPSIKLVERLGFRREGHLVESLFLNGKWVDEVVYAILNDEWQSE